MLSPPKGQVKCGSPTVVIIVQCPDNMVMRSWGRHYQSDRSWNTALTVRWLIIWTSRVQCWIQCCAICSRHIDTSTLHTHTYCLSPRTWVSNITGLGSWLGTSSHREGRSWCWIAGGRDAGFAELKYLSRTMMDATDVADWGHWLVAPGTVARVATLVTWSPAPWCHMNRALNGISRNFTLPGEGSH